MRHCRRWPPEAHDDHRRIDDDLEHHDARYDVDHDHGAFHRHHRPRRHHDHHSGHHDDRGPDHHRGVDHDDMGTAGRAARDPADGATGNYPAAGGFIPTPAPAAHRVAAAVTWAELGIGGAGLVIGYLLGRWRRRFYRIVVVVEGEPPGPGRPS